MNDGAESFPPSAWSCGTADGERRKSAISNSVKRTKKYMLWTPEEEALLKSRYKEVGYKVVDLPEFSHRGSVSIIRKIGNMRLKRDRKEQFSDENERIGYFDIETDHLKADFGKVLSWVIKEAGKRRYDWALITREELWSADEDKRLIRELMDCLRKYTVIVTYYGTRFDFPFVRTRALSHGFDFIPHGEIHHRDLYYKVRNKLCLHRNRLEVACEHLGIQGKTQVKPAIWQAAKRGDERALQYVKRHNFADVRILERLHQKIARYTASTRKYV